MRVKTLCDEPRLGIRAGEIYSAAPCRTRLYDQVTLLNREPDGHFSGFAVYAADVAYWVKGEWQNVRGEPLAAAP